ncbi:MAG: Cys-tRNA(Pro) deacylase [Bacilli bacterium]
MKIQKTTPMRMLDAAKVTYIALPYDCTDGAIDGISVARKIDKPEEIVFKTLVVQSTTKKLYVCVIPVAAKLDLKAVAQATGEKKMELFSVAQLKQQTGYERGGCSPIGMKKPLTTLIDASAQLLTTMVVSGGKIGLQIELSPADLIQMTNGMFAEIAVD